MVAGFWPLAVPRVARNSPFPTRQKARLTKAQPLKAPKRFGAFFLACAELGTHKAPRRLYETIRNKLLPLKDECVNNHRGMSFLNFLKTKIFWAQVGLAVAATIVLLVLVITLLLTKRYIHQTFTWWAELTFLLLALATMAGVMGYSLTHLPFIDFRPYKIGNHLPTLMEVPDDAPHDVYATTFIYEKDGVEQEFTLENYPKGDSTWTFVDQKSVLVQKGFEPAVHDFELLNLNYEDMTFDILESEEPVTLLVMYDLNKTDRSLLPKVQALCEQCRANNKPFYILTGSDEQTIEEFFADLGDISPEECVLTCDGVTLKTIVRANPGVVVLQNGTVMEKYNLANYELRINN